MIKERNYGIDFLRILSMIFVIILHCNWQGGLLEGFAINSATNTLQYRFVNFIDIIAYCAVDLFGLISGYVAYTEKEKNVKYYKFFLLWLQVVFCGLMCTLIFDIFNPNIVTLNDYIFHLFPIFTKSYWYFSAYAGLFLLMPLLNKAIRSCDNTTLRKIFVSIILVFSIYNVFFNDFNVSSGYSLIWLLLLYVLGAIIKKCNIGKTLKLYQAIILIIILLFSTYLYKIYGYEGTINIFNISFSKNLFISYISPTILIISVLYIIAFSKISFSKCVNKIISFISASTFSVYIINCQYHFWNYILKNKFINLGSTSIINIFIKITAFTILFFLFSLFIDKIRVLFFKIIKAEKIAKKIELNLNKLISKISNII